MMGQGRINEALSWAAGLRRGGAPVTAKAGGYLRTRYTDDEAEAMAQEDGEVGLLGPAAGPGNRVLHGEQAVRESSATGALGVRNYLDGGQLGKVRAAHARALQAFRAGKAEVRKALTAVIRENARLEGLRNRLAGESLDPPVPRWAGTAFLAVLGIGDLTVTSVSFMVLNISDRPFVSWLPFSALTVAAIPVVGGMLGAAHFLGESIRARQHEPGLRPVIIGAVSLVGGLSLALAIAAIRNAFLAASGVMTVSLPFFGIQIGLFAVATAASAWAAHPFHAQWKAAARAVCHANRGYRTARRRAGKLAGLVNGLAAKQLTLVSKAASGAWAVLSDGTRQRYLYRRAYALGSSPEPVAEDLWGLPAKPELPWEVLDLLEYPDRIRQGSNLEPLESVNLEDLDAAWENLQQQMQDKADAARRAGEERDLAPGAYILNGASREASAQKHNGGPGPGAS
jgi:cytochrome c553